MNIRSTVQKPFELTISSQYHISKQLIKLSYITLFRSLQQYISVLIVIVPLYYAGGGLLSCISRQDMNNIVLHSGNNTLFIRW